MVFSESSNVSAAPVSSSSKRQWAALSILVLAVLLLAIDGTVLSLAIPSLVADLNPSATQLLWIGDAYSFALAGLLITMGNLADRIGRKKLLLFGALGFGISSVVAGLAQTPEMLIFARALLGVSGATIMPSTLSIVRNLFNDPIQRTRAIAFWSAGATAGAAIGPLVGGFLLEHFWWGSVFLINIPVMLLVLVGGFFLIPESKNPSAKSIDMLSVLLSVLMIVPAVYAIKQVFSHGFQLDVVITLAVSVLAGTLFIRRQNKIPTPLVDTKLFAIPAFSGAVIANGVAIFAFSGLLFFFSQYLQLVRQMTPLHAGMVELSATITSLMVIAVAVLAVRVFGRGKAISIGLLLAALGLLGLAGAEYLDSLVAIIAALGVIGLGIGLASTLSTDAVVSSVPKERAGAASSIAETAYELGVAFGIAVLGSVQTLLYRSHLDIPGGTSGEVQNSLRESLASAVVNLDPSVPSEMILIEQARAAFTAAMETTSLIAAVLLVVSAIIAWKVIPANKESQPV